MGVSPMTSPSSSRMVAKAVQIPISVAEKPINGHGTSDQQAHTSQRLYTEQKAASPQRPAIQPMVIIPPSSEESRKSDFVTYDLPAESSISRKRKRGFGSETVILPSETRDQKAAIDGLLHQFSDLLEEVFEADNQSLSKSQYFVTATADDREVNTLATDVHVKLDLSLQKIISYGRLSDVTVDDLRRLQSLSEGALASTEAQDLYYDSDWGSDEFEAWIQRLDSVDLGLRSARTILRTMIGGREEKQLYPEELLLSISRMVQKVADCCIIPVVETRASSSSEGVVEQLSTYKKRLSHVLHESNKVLSLLCKLLAKEEMAETVITPIEFFAVRLIFVENASTEKESLLGTQRYETLRRTAMDMIAIIFSRYPAQRVFLFDEILTSLQRLPTGRQAARQYRLSDGRAIQLVTALIMQLVQTSAAVAKSAKKSSKPSRALRDEESAKSREIPTDEEEDDDNASENSDEADEADDGLTDSLRRLRRESTALCDAAAKSAQHAVGYLMQRAQTASKSGDQPHRQLLDIFVEDLLMVLGFPEWPGAELLLRAVCARAIHTFDNAKSLAPAKNMALELLGTMGSAISDLVASTRHAVKGLDDQNSEYNSHVRQLFEDYADGSLEPSELLMWDGPYHAVVESFEKASPDDFQLVSAQAYFLAQWSKGVSTSGIKITPEVEKLASRLHVMLSSNDWVVSDTLSSITESQSRISYALSVLNMDFCRRFDYMLRILLDSVTSEQTTVRSRGLKSVTQMLEKDPSILDRARNVKNIILRCAADPSPMVRDAALTLIGKCITLKPNLESEFLSHILRLGNDAAIGVRKRAMKLLKDIYLRNSSQEMKATIGENLLQRAKDPDNSVVDLARQTLEDIWLAPFWTFSDLSQPGAKVEMSLRSQVLLVVRTVCRSANASLVLVSLLKELLSSTSKNAGANAKVCKSFVATAFEIMIDSNSIPDAPEQSQVLETLTMFAKAHPRLFGSDQLQILQPYISSVNTIEDLDIFRPAVVIFRCVLPVLSSVEHKMLETIHDTLISRVSKLSKKELGEVAECLWTINSTIDKVQSLIKVLASVLKGLHDLENADFNDAKEKANMLRAKKFMTIAGYFEKHCDFDKHSTSFKPLIPWFQGGSIVGFTVQSLLPFTYSKQPLTLQSAAFHSIGLICQSWPFQFTTPAVSKTFASTLQHGDPDLQQIVLSNFRDFFANAEHQSSPKTEESGGGNNPTAPKLGGSMTANERDSASALITQHFIKDILGIALASQDGSALTATEVIASINRQGLAHPKESGPALVALGTSTQPDIAQVAFQEHRLLHQQHESMFEREYMRAIYEAFKYQRNVVKDPVGFTGQPVTAKLNGMWEIIKTSKAKYQKKFLANYCSKIDFDPSKMDTSGEPPITLQFSRFLTENIAFFDFTRLDELLHAIACMEKTVADTGSNVAHSISTEVFHLTVQADASKTEDKKDPRAAVDTTTGDGIELGPPQQPQTSTAEEKQAVDPARLKHLTTGAVILSSLWEARTYLRRLYGQSANQQRRENGKGRPPTKDLSKAPTRVQGVSGERLISCIAEKVASLSTNEGMMKQCEEFIELLSVDSEVKVNAESDDGLGERLETPGLDEAEEKDTPMSGASRGLKRKNSFSTNGTPSKRRGRPPMTKRKSSRKSVDKDGDSDGDWE